ncbi:MAG: hypothetical protein HQL55_20575, partial [Magnetococcales bacterium]|nr:hypothetical protein [Magnetococcales bacterium]
MRISILALLASLALAACSEQPADSKKGKATGSTTAAQPAAPAPQPAPPAAQPAPAQPAAASKEVVVDYRVLDQFEVGDKVYVRSFLLDDKQQSLWIGTSLGVHEIDLKNQQVKQTFTRDHGLANEYVFGMGRDRDGYIWFGTNAGGASRFKDGKWQTFFPMHGLADYWVYTFANHPDGKLWVGTWAGVSRFDPDTGKFENFVKELINEWVYAIDIDSQKRTWFGTEGGISRFDGKEWKSWNHDDGLGADNTENLPNSINTGLGTRKRHDL